MSFEILSSRAKKINPQGITKIRIETSPYGHKYVGSPVTHSLTKNNKQERVSRKPNMSNTILRRFVSKISFASKMTASFLDCEQPRLDFPLEAGI